MLLMKRTFLCVSVALTLYACRVKSNSCQRLSSDVISKSWQSSSYHSEGRQLCGIQQRDNDVCKHVVFHTAVGSLQVECGYHWLAVELKQPMAIEAVLITGGGCGWTNSDSLISRLQDIEVWTTSSRDVDFGSEQCTTTFESIFKRSQWTSCGRTRATSKVVDGNMKAQCTEATMVSLILLRKYVTNISEPESQCLSFGSMHFVKGATPEAKFEPSFPVKQNLTVNVSCDVQCPGQHSEVRLCHVDSGKCFGNKELPRVISRVQPVNAGSYRCTVGPGEIFSVGNLTVLYAPSSLKIYVVESSCTSETSHLTLAFESSAAEPKPSHSCAAFDLNGHYVTLRRQNTQLEITSGASPLKSYWLCQNCSTGSNVTVHCSAVQLSKSAGNDAASAAANLLWNSTTEGSLEKIRFDSCYVAASASYVMYYVIALIGVAAAACVITSIAIVRNTIARGSSSSVQNPENCTYTAVVGKQMEETTEVNRQVTSSSSDDAGSDVTAYLEILADGEFQLDSEENSGAL